MKTVAANLFPALLSYKVLLLQTKYKYKVLVKSPFFAQNAYKEDKRGTRTTSTPPLIANRTL